MIYRPLGNTGLEVSFLGFGAGHIGSTDLSEDQAGTLLNRALDRGINFVDTARGYGLSEERIGRHLSWRRQDFILSTKVGYGVEGAPDWTYASVVRGAEEALVKMRTSWIDVVLLHSCPREVLLREEILRALEDVRSRGLARFTGYSGENEDLEAALGVDQVQVVETSVNLCDQGNISDVLAPEGRFSRLGSRGVIAKRPLANGFWRYPDRPWGQYAEEYWVRWQTLASRLSAEITRMPRDILAMEFLARVPQVSTGIVGTGSLENLEKNIKMAEGLQGDGRVYLALREAWLSQSQGWRGQV